MSDWMKWIENNSFECPRCTSVERTPRVSSTSGTAMAGWSCLCKGLAKNTPTGKTLSNTSTAAGHWSSLKAADSLVLLEGILLAAHITTRKPLNIESEVYDNACVSNL